jgi:hypothetical protein
VIVIFLYYGDARQAWKAYQKSLDVEEFSSSPEAYAAENLLQAYCSGDVQVIKEKASQGRCWVALDAQVPFLAFPCEKTRGRGVVMGDLSRYHQHVETAIMRELEDLRQS